MKYFIALLDVLLKTDTYIYITIIKLVKFDSRILCFALYLPSDTEQKYNTICIVQYNTIQYNICILYAYYIISLRMLILMQIIVFERRLWKTCVRSQFIIFSKYNMLKLTNKTKGVVVCL